MAASAKQSEDFCPLYERGRWAPRLQDHGHVGLWYDKYSNRWAWEDEDRLAFDKQKWISSVAEQKDLWENTHLAESVRRQARMAAALGGRVLRLKSMSRFVTGLGREHPVENGFAFHPTLGTPHLPGSGLKGALKAWVRESTDGTDGGVLEEWFGTPGRAGSLVVLDLLPATPPRLVCEIMTPHYGPYYNPGGDTGDVPGDWHSPVPIPFLAVESGAAWQTAILHGPGCTAPQALLRDAETALVDALSWLGAGAKTALGYGQFELDEKATTKLRRELEREEAARHGKRELEARTRHLSPAARKFERACASGGWETSKDSFAGGGQIESWLDQLEQSPDGHIIARLEELVRRHFPRLLENPEATKGKRRKLVFSERQRNVARRLNALRRQSEDTQEQ